MGQLRTANKRRKRLLATRAAVIADAIKPAAPVKPAKAAAA